MRLDRAAIIKECVFSTARSGGKGGQHVNKVETKVIVKFDIQQSAVLSDHQKEKLVIKLHNKLSNGVVVISAESTRSQLKNKEIVIQKLMKLLMDGLKEPKKRLPTKISKAKKAARLDQKKSHSQKKSLRKNPRKDDY